MIVVFQIVVIAHRVTFCSFRTALPLQTFTSLLLRFVLRRCKFVKAFASADLRGGVTLMREGQGVEESAGRLETEGLGEDGRRLFFRSLFNVGD